MISVISCTRFSLTSWTSLDELDVVDDDQVEPPLALQAAGAGRQLRDRDAARVVDIERASTASPGGDDEARELLLGQVAAADLVGGTLACSAITRVASCSADISSEKKPTDPPSMVLWAPSGRVS